MTNDSSLLSELWDIVKEQLNESQYLTVCDDMIRVMDSHNVSDGFVEGGFDEYMNMAIVTYYELGLEDGDEEEHDDD